MRCPKCGSEHTTINAKEVKPNFTLALCLIFGGIGLMFFGIGAIFGVLIGLLIGLILKSVLPVGYESILVCQSCGHTTKIKKQTNSSPINTISKENTDDTNLIISRDNISICSAVVMQIKIDNATIYDLSNGQTIELKLAQGIHKISYLQKNGMGKKYRQGDFEVLVGDDIKVVRFMLTQNGINVIQN